MDLKKLNEPLDISQIDFRVQSINKGGYATILAYKDARVDMNRLDDVVGALNWQRKHEIVNGNLFCQVGVYNSDISSWVWKSDVGAETFSDKEKGQASDAFKRACFNWGIGRELYDYPAISVKLKDNEFEVKDGKAKQTYNLKLKEWRWYSEFTEGKLTFLAAKDQDGSLRFKFGTIKAKDEPTYKQSSDASEEKEATPTEAIQEEVKPGAKSEANIGGLLKKPADQSEIETSVDEERASLVAEHEQLLGKKPHGKTSTENIKKAIDEHKLFMVKTQMDAEEVIEEADVIEEAIDVLENAIQTGTSFTNTKDMVSWWKEKEGELKEVLSDEEMVFLKSKFNEHYKSLSNG